MSAHKKSLVLLTTALLLLFYGGCASTSRNKFEGDRKMKITSSPNYRNGKFVNLTDTTLKLQKSSCSMINEYVRGRQQRVPKTPIPTVALRRESFSPASEDLRITWLGHSTVIIEIEGTVVVTDPNFSSRVSPIPNTGPKRFSRENPLSIDDLPDIDVVIISHDHYDHLDYETIKGIKDRVARFIVPLGVGAYLEKWGVPAKKITELDWWETETAGVLRFTAAPARHFSGRIILNRDDTLWASWAIRGKKHSVFFSGDTSYSASFREIGERLGPFDVTLIETGQYSPYWPQVHMVPEESLQAHIDVRGSVMIPVHWGAFCLSIHDWFEPAERLVKAAQEKGQTVATPMQGEQYIFGRPLPLKKWWRIEKIQPAGSSTDKPVPAGI